MSLIEHEIIQQHVVNFEEIEEMTTEIEGETKKNFNENRLLIMIVLCMCIGLLFRPDTAGAASGKTFKVLHLMSYSMDWPWNKDQFNGFQEALKEIDITYRIFEMDTKRKSDPEWIRKVSQEAKILIENWKPDLVYANDDAAQEYIVKEYVNTDIPFVFSGVNALPEQYGFAESKNVPYQTVLRWVAEHSHLPDFAYWRARIEYGTLCAVTVSGYEQGLAAGKIARGILLEGKSPSSYPMRPSRSRKGEAVISLARARKLGLQVSSDILLIAEVMTKLVWEK